MSYAPTPNLDLNIAVNLDGWTFLPGISKYDSTSSGASCIAGASDAVMFVDIETDDEVRQRI